MRKICFPKGIFYWKGISVNKKIWGHRSTYPTAKEYFGEDDFINTLFALMILKGTLEVAFDA
jgi:hypothetical protein